jgi:methylated-DNA-protein-cysteine methyltransferase related protein
VRATRDNRTSRLIKQAASAAFARVYQVVRRIPRGRVMTYGAVARLAGMPRGARIVGYAMRASNGRVPWQRVVGLRRPGVAHVSIKDPIGGARQRQLLEREGVRFDARGGISLTRYGAGPERPARGKGVARGRRGAPEKANGRPGRPGRPRRSR